MSSWNTSALVSSKRKPICSLHDLVVIWIKAWHKVGTQQSSLFPNCKEAIVVVTVSNNNKLHPGKLRYMAVEEHSLLATGQGFMLWKSDRKGLTQNILQIAAQARIRPRNCLMYCACWKTHRVWVIPHCKVQPNHSAKPKPDGKSPSMTSWNRQRCAPSAPKHNQIQENEYEIWHISTLFHTLAESCAGAERWSSAVRSPLASSAWGASRWRCFWTEMREAEILWHLQVNCILRKC